MARFGRIALDQWFTPDEWAQALTDDLLKELPELKGRQFVEPSAGGGAFLRALQHRGESVIGYDLDPQDDDIIEADFLKDEIDLAGKVVIGNPPYGRAHSLSRAFVKRAFDQGATYVAFLLPLGFMRTSVLNVGRRVEYFKTLPGMSFEAVDGSELPAPAKMIVWVVMSKDELQASEEFFARARFFEADSFWLQGYEYGIECEPEIYRKASSDGIFIGTRSDGKRVTGASYRKLKPIPENLDTLRLVAQWSGNRGQPTAATANFLLSNPEVYRGTLGL